MNELDTDFVVAWSRLSHIGAHAGSTEFRPDSGELNLDIVRQACESAWIYRSADFEPSLNVLLTKSQWRETCGLAGSMAESLMLGLATQIEAVWHTRLLEAGTEPRGMAIAQRYLADNAIDTAVSVGHRLINFVVRVARTDPATSETLGNTKGLEQLGPTYEPFTTDHPRAWMSLRKDEVKKLRKVLPEVHHPALDILDRLLTSSEWNAVFAIRGENHHRWRKEHESVVGVDAQSGHQRDHFDSEGNWTGRSGGGHGRRHTLGDGLTQKTTDAAGDGLRVVSEALKDVIEHTIDVLPSVARGHTIAWDGKRIRQTRQIPGSQAVAQTDPDGTEEPRQPDSSDATS